MTKCKNCKAEFLGNYCNFCGEKIINDNDFTIKSIASQAIGSITNFDSKIFKTLKLLFFYPGKLTTKFVEGVRVPYLKPFQLFVISNILFFLFLSEIDLFRTPSKWFFQEDYDGIRVLDIVRKISNIQGLDITEIAHKYDAQSSKLAKGLIVFLIPFIALVGKLLNPKKPIEYGKHIIFSTYYFSFVLLVCVIISQIVEALSTPNSKWFFIVPITTLMILHYVFGMKQFYNNNWITAIFKGLIGVFLINLIIQFYRIGINLLSLNTI